MAKNNTDAIIDPYESQTSDTIIDPYEQGAVVASEEKKKNFLTKLAEGVKQVDWGLLSQSPRAALELAAMQASGVGGAVGGAATGLATHGIVSAGKALGGFKDIPSAADAAKAVSQGVANVLTYDPRKSATSTELGRRAADIMTGEAEESSMPITNFLATLPFKSAEAISGIGKDVVKTAGEMYRQTPLGKVTPEGVYEFAEYPAEVVGEFAPWVLAERGVTKGSTRAKNVLREAVTERKINKARAEGLAAEEARLARVAEQKARVTEAVRKSAEARKGKSRCESNCRGTLKA